MTCAPLASVDCGGDMVRSKTPDVSEKRACQFKDFMFPLFPHAIASFTQQQREKKNLKAPAHKYTHLSGVAIYENRSSATNVICHHKCQSESYTSRVNSSLYTDDLKLFLKCHIRICYHLTCGVFIYCRQPHLMFYSNKNGQYCASLT